MNLYVYVVICISLSFTAFMLRMYFFMSRLYKHLPIYFLACLELYIISLNLFGAFVVK